MRFVDLLIIALAAISLGLSLLYGPWLLGILRDWLRGLVGRNPQAFTRGGYEALRRAQGSHRNFGSPGAVGVSWSEPGPWHPPLDPITRAIADGTHPPIDHDAESFTPFPECP